MKEIESDIGIRLDQAFGSLTQAIEELCEATAEALKPRRYLYDLKTCCSIKGDNYHSVSTNRHMQPMAGYSNHTEGRKRMWTEEQLQEWVTVTSETRALYLESLLTRLDVGDGVLAELMAQHSAGTLPDYLVSVIEGHICRH